MPERGSTTSALSPSAVRAVANDIRLACMRISRRVRFESSGPLAPHQFSVLARLEGAPHTPRELAAIECVSAPSMTRTVTGLVERGLVDRADDPEDGRQVILTLTGDGRSVLRDVRRTRDEWMAVRVSALTPEEQDVLRRASLVLARVAAA